MSIWAFLVLIFMGSNYGFDAENATSAPLGLRCDGALKLNIGLSGSLQNPAFSPDGNQIVFTRFQDGYNLGPSDLFIYNLENGKLQALVADGSSNVNVPGASWNETRKSIVFSSDRGNHNEIFSIAANGKPGDETQLTSRQNLQALEPSYSPFGRWVVFESHSNDEERGVIVKYWHDGGRPVVALSEAGQSIKQPNWSPRGDKILYQQFADDYWSIWVMNVDGSQKRQVTPSNWEATDASFTPDGNGIVFSGQEASFSDANIFETSLSGGVPVRITRFNGYDGAPSIADGRNLMVFESSLDHSPANSATSLWIIER